ncbi:haloacid dehalogenase type II [Ruania alba]|uniref:2-haloacid dehalogenase n=1 Tax=Ruania alba TaxID=648782 RepID=A0A1H5HQ49_9MICO|nr:haloacid dehalogenase type II [Ruania alba]SEE29950.1 2-haloacid dehalogenase [Ruania alba]
MSTRPRYLTFDCYGTLTAFGMSAATREIFAGRVPGEQMEEFLEWFSVYRGDEVMGDWRPYREIITRALVRAARRVGVEATDTDADQIYEQVPTWGPHPDVPDGLVTLAEQYRLVILTNAADEQISGNVGQLGAPFHAVITAEQARAYKPRLQAFEHMLTELDCAPSEVVHVSASPRYDLQPATDLGITQTVYLNRGYEPSAPYYHRYEVSSLTELAEVLEG